MDLRVVRKHAQEDCFIQTLSIKQLQIHRKANISDYILVSLLSTAKIHI